MQLFEGRFGGHCHDIGTRRHNLAHALVAEFDDLFDKVALFRFDDALFFRSFHQRFDSLFGALLFSLLDLMLRDPRERLRTFQEYAHRPDEPHRSPNQRQQRKQPASRGAVQQHVRNKVHREDHFNRKKHGELNEGLPGARDEVHYAPRRLQY